MADSTDETGRPSLTAQRNALLAAKLAAEHIPTCIAELAKLAKSSGRPSVRRQAATDLIRIATQLQLDEKLDAAAPKSEGKLTLVDAKLAAEVIRERLQNQNR